MRGLILVVVATAMMACRPTHPTVVLSATLAGSDQDRVLILSSSPSNVSAAGEGLTPKVMFDVGGASEDIGYPIDVEELADGRIAALDMETPGIWLLDAEGRPAQRTGRQGDGPGELQSPIGIARAGALLVVTGVRKDRALAFIDTTGRPVGHLRPPIPGDWSRATSRPPGPGTDLPRYPGNEDVARRLVSLDDTSVGIIVAANEWEYPPDEADPGHMSPRPVVAVRIAVPSGRVIDTLWRGLTPEAWREEIRADLMPNWPFPLFAPWPSLASGEGWSAWTAGGEGEIQLTGHTAISSIRWPVHPVPVNDALKEQQFDWLKQVLIRQDEHWQVWWDSLGAEARAEAKQGQMTRYRWAERTPEVMAMFGHGRCLWITGFSHDDGPLGVGRSWIVINVVAGTLMGVVRLPDPWWRLRSVGYSGAYATYRDDEGLSHLVKLAPPEGFDACAA